MGPIKVFNAIGNWPYSIHLLTSYGIYIYTFDKDLTNRTEIFPDFKNNLKIEKKLILRIYFNDDYSEIAGNSFGYAFLTKIYTS